jgi:hypothetical protein
MLTAKDIHKHEGYNICGKCYVDIHNPRVSMIGINKFISFYFARNFLLREKRLLQRGEKGWRGRLKRGRGEGRRGKRSSWNRCTFNHVIRYLNYVFQEMAEAEEFKFSFLKIAEIVGIAPDVRYGL